MYIYNDNYNNNNDNEHDNDNDNNNADSNNDNIMYRTIQNGGLREEKGGPGPGTRAGCHSEGDKWGQH